MHKEETDKDDDIDNNMIISVDEKAELLVVSQHQKKLKKDNYMAYNRYRFFWTMINTSLYLIMFF